MRTALKCLTLVCVLLLPATALAQASLTGTVRDGSGGVLPGVTVETSSPVLIEKTRSAVTDGTGQWRIVDLRPGTYSLTFTLPGFVTVKRDNIELTGSQTLTIPVELRVGGIEETITVTGESPIVDVSNARREIVLSSETIQRIPATRAAGALLGAAPGVVVGDAGAAISPTMTSFNARSSTINAGSVAGEGRYAINKKQIDSRSVAVLSAELAGAAGGAKDPVVVVSADANAAHQSVINVMDAARRAGLSRLTFATQSSAGSPAN